MERVTFLVEATGERLDALLNPETIDISRRSGLRPRRSLGGALTGQGSSDDALHYTGGGRTEMRFDLLFDVALEETASPVEDVRILTRRLWSLSENQAGPDGFGKLPRVRFLWGKSWNIPGVVAAIAERFDSFTPEGVPRRSWLRMQFVRVEPGRETTPAGGSGPAPFDLEQSTGPFEVDPDRLRVHEITSGGATEKGRVVGERLDQVAQRYYGDPSFWRLLAGFNQMDDPFAIGGGAVLRVPPPTSPGGSGQ